MILLKYILRCIWKNKARTGLILCAITISSGMLFSSVSISSTLVQLQLDAWRCNYGYSDIIIQANDSSPSSWFYMNEVLRWEPSCDYIIGEVTGFGILETSSGEQFQTALHGIVWDELQRLTPIPLSSDAGILPFTGRKLILGEKTAEALKLSPGDTVVLTINGTHQVLKLSGIASDEGFLSGSGPTLSAVIPREQLASLLDIPGRVDRIYIKLRHPELKYRLITKLSVPYSRYTVREAFSAAEVKLQTDRTAMPIIIVAVILSFMSIYILYSAFKVIMLERLPILGTFRSIGATIGSARSILLIESVTYGVIGGFTGCVAGFALLLLMSDILSPAKGNTFSLPTINPLYLALSFSSAIILSLAGAAIPTIKVSKLPVKDLIFTSLTAVRKKGFALLGILLFALSIVSPSVIDAQVYRWGSILSVILALTSAVLLVPLMTRIFRISLGWLFRFLFGNEGYLAMGQICSNKNNHHNIALLVIGVAALFMVTTLNEGEIRQIMDTFDRCYYDIIVQFPHSGRNNKKLLGELDGIQAVMENQEGPVTFLEGFDEPLYHLQGINIEEFEQFHTLLEPEGQMNQLRHLDEGRNILLTTILRDKWNLKAGDPITLILCGKNGEKFRRTYTIIGFFDNFFPGLWSYGLISEHNFKRDIGIDSAGAYYVKSSGNTEKAVAAIEAELARQKPAVQTVEELQREILSENNRVFSILRFFSVITAVAGTFGVLNNMIISYLERKRTLAILRSLGMTRWKVMKMLVVEGFATGLLGGAAGTGAGVLILTRIIPYVIRATGSEMRIMLDISIMLYCFCAAVIISVLASVGPVTRTGSMNLIAEVQYE